MRNGPTTANICHERCCIFQRHSRTSINNGHFATLHTARRIGFHYYSISEFFIATTFPAGDTLRAL